MGKTEKLKPCPFCGMPASYDGEYGLISCMHNKGCGFYYEAPNGLTKEVVEKWNTRATSEVVEALEKVREKVEKKLNASLSATSIGHNGGMDTRWNEGYSDCCRELKVLLNTAIKEEQEAKGE